MANVKLQIVSVQDYNTTIGRSQQDYAVFECITPENQFVNVAVTHNALTKKAGITDISSLDNLTGSSIVATQNTDINTGVVTEADERLEQVLDGTYRILVLNGSNCSILKSDSFTAKNNEMQSAIKAKLIIEKEKERKAISLERATQRFNEKMAKLRAQQEQAIEAEVSSEIQEAEVVAEVEQEPEF